MRVTFSAVSFCGQQLPHTLRGKQLESDLPFCHIDRQLLRSGTRSWAACLETRRWGGVTSRGLVGERSTTETNRVRHHAKPTRRKV